MKRHWRFILIINLLPLVTVGQVNYFLKDSTKSVGVKLLDRGDLMNSSYCHIKKGEKIVQYSPLEVQEYGFKDGRVYISKEIQISDIVKRVFLERLVVGSANLYFYRGEKTKMFYLEKDSNLLVELPRFEKKKSIGFRDILKNKISDCQSINDAVKLVSYKKIPLSKLIKRYNSCDLRSRPFPHLKFGFTVGYEYSNMIITTNYLNKYYNNLKVQYDGGYTIGLFIDNPVLASDYSLRIELYYSLHEFSEINYELSSLKFPIMMRYVYPSNKLRPFVNLGGNFMYNIKKENLEIESTPTATVTDFTTLKEPLIVDNFLAGYSIGGGVEYKLNSRNLISFEVRYTKLFGLSNFKSLDSSAINFITGISF